MDFCLSMSPSLLAAFSFSDPAGWWAIGQMVFGLGFVIFVHELGHFLVAKACGVKCEKFYVGFDMFEIKIGDRVIIPRALLKAKIGETEYGLGIVPLGGYVKMLGQDDNPSKIAEEHQRSIKNTDEGQADVPADQDPSADDTGPLDRSQLDPRSYQAKKRLAADGDYLGRGHHEFDLCRDLCHDRVPIGRQLYPDQYWQR